MRVEVSHVVPAPRDVVWSVIADLPAMPRWLEGLARWEHAGGPTSGLGARWTMRLRVGSADVGGLVEYVEWDEGLDVAYTSVTGLDQRGRIRLRDHQGGTRVTIRLSFQAPGMFLGRIAEIVAAPMVRPMLRDSLLTLSLEAQRRALPSRRARRRPSDS